MQKVTKIVLLGEPDNNQPFNIMLKGFFVFYEIILLKRRI
jgi:hypothetical protein